MWQCLLPLWSAYTHAYFYCSYYSSIYCEALWGWKSSWTTTNTFTAYFFCSFLGPKTCFIALHIMRQGPQDCFIMPYIWDKTPRPFSHTPHIMRQLHFITLNTKLIISSFSLPTNRHDITGGLCPDMSGHSCDTDAFPDTGGHFLTFTDIVCCWWHLTLIDISWH